MRLSLLIVPLLTLTATAETRGPAIHLPANTSGWSVMLDLQDTVPEINEGNNRLPVGK